MFIFFLVLILISMLLRYNNPPNNEVSNEPKQNREQGSVDRKLVEPSGNFIAGRPKAAVLFYVLF